jgi:adenine-specific DNA-methyltransferase
MNDTHKKLIDVLKKDDRLVVDKKLAKNKVIELALQLDADLLRLLRTSKDLMQTFFQKVDDVLVFDKVKFQSFVSNKQFLPDSFTEYKNKIGLASGKQYLTDNNEVVIAFPYKDCVLEGGQTKEDAKRNEVFWNETLAPDEIDKLLEPKVITNLKKYDSKGEHSVKDISPEDNLIIKGNNLLALHSLKKTHKGKVKLIYIDPPYNTGTDSFQYNDNFNHSTWLTFIKNRFQIARDLLREDGTIFISIDENELGYLQVLCDEIFGRENRANLISVKRGSVTGHKAINPGVVNITEYLLAYAKNKKSWKPNKVLRQRERNERYNVFIKHAEEDCSKWKFGSLLDAFSEEKGIKKTQLKKELGDDFEMEIFEFIKKNPLAVVQFAYPDPDKVSKETKELIKKSVANKDVVYYQGRDNEADLYLINGQRILFYADRLIEMDGELVTGEPLSDFWDDVLPNDLHNEGGVSFKKGKKPEKLISRIMELSTKEGDLVMDFHLGSGTTCAVALKMKRRFIGIEQMDYAENDSVNRLKNVIKGDSAGVSKTANWKGGGSFVYAELARVNQNFVDKIQDAKNTKELLKLWDEMKKTAFLSYRVKPEEIDATKKDFESLVFEDQQRLLVSLLDKNMLYIPYSEIDDKTYAISKEDKELNAKFYGEK